MAETKSDGLHDDKRGDAPTPRTDRQPTCDDGHAVRIEFARQLERELAAMQALAAQAAVAPRKMFPIMRGPAVPWDVMAPHEHQAQRNHSQTLQRLAERGGLGTGEAWCVVNGLDLDFFDKAKWAEYEKKWCLFAERINLHFDELDRLRETVARSATAASKEFAERCRPAARAWAINTEKAVSMCAAGKFPEHYKAALDNEADRASKLLEEIDGILKTATDRETTKP